MKLCLSFIAAAFLAVGCAAESSNDDRTASDDADLSATRVTVLEINRGTGFVPPAPAGSCNAFGNWKVDFEAKKLTGLGCIEGRLLSNDRAVTDEEIALLRKAITDTKTAPKPLACPTDFPVTSLTLTRGDSIWRYIDEKASCDSTARPLRGETVGALFQTVQKLAFIDATHEIENE